MAGLSNATSQQDLDNTQFIVSDFIPKMEIWYIILGIPTILVAFCGNLGTIIAFYTEPSLNAKPSNLITLNLAFADLGMSVFTIPIFQIMVGAMGYWPWGELPCRVILSIAMVLVFAGVLFIILMSWDRYLLLALEYSDYVKKQNSKRLKIVILVTWLAAMSQAVYEAATWDIIIAATPAQYRTDFSKECECPSMKTLTASMFCAFIFSIFPIASIALLGTLIVARLRKRLMHWRHVGYDGTSGTSWRSSTVSTLGAKFEQRSTSACISNAYGSAECKANNADRDPAKNGKQTSVNQSHATLKEPFPTSLTSTAEPSSSTIENKIGMTRKDRTIQKRYIKPVLTYVVLVLSLAGCTLPLYVYILYVNISCPVCYDYFTAGYFFGILFFNSALNPLLYALTNVKIREFYYKRYNAVRRWMLGR